MKAASALNSAGRGAVTGKSTAFSVGALSAAGRLGDSRAEIPRSPRRVHKVESAGLLLIGAARQDDVSVI